MNKVRSKYVEWIDVEEPTDEDVEELKEIYSLDTIVSRELLHATYRPKVEDHEDHLYLVLHFPFFDSNRRSSVGREIDFIIWKTTLVTIHYDPVPRLDNFQELLQKNEQLREKAFGKNSGILLRNIIFELFTTSLRELDKIKIRIDDIEEKIFEGMEHQMLKEIALVRRDVLNFRKALKPQQAVLDSLEERGETFFGASMGPYFTDIKTSYVQVLNAVENLKETLDVLHDTNMSLLSTKTNDTMKVLTIISSILLPMTLITGIFGMNIHSMPFVEEPGGFLIILLSMAVLGAVVGLLLRLKRWI